MTTSNTSRKRAKTNAKREGAALYEGRDCQCCGKRLPPRKSKRGRPRLYCDDDCQKLNALLEWAEATMDTKMLDFTDDAADQLKSRLFGIANSWFWERKREQKRLAAAQ